MSDEEAIQARLSYDPSVDLWYCEVGFPDEAAGDTLVMGQGPSALTAAMNAAERASAQLHAGLGTPVRILDGDQGWIVLDIHGMSGVVEPETSEQQ